MGWNERERYCSHVASLILLLSFSSHRAGGVCAEMNLYVCTCMCVCVFEFVNASDTHTPTSKLFQIITTYCTYDYVVVAASATSLVVLLIMTWLGTHNNNDPIMNGVAFHMVTCWPLRIQLGTDPLRISRNTHRLTFLFDCEANNNRRRLNNN